MPLSDGESWGGLRPSCGREPWTREESRARRSLGGEGSRCSLRALLLRANRMRFTLVMLAAVPLASSFAPSGGFNLAKVGAPAVAHPRAASLSARRPARLLDLKATAAAPLVVAESEYTVPEWRKKVDLKAWADEVRAVEKKYRQAQGEEDVKHMKKMLNWTYVLYAIGEPSCVAPLSLVTHRGIYINLRPKFTRVQT
jgi:hypothetical protein